MKLSLICILLVGFTGCSFADIVSEETEEITKIVKYNPDIQTVMFNNCITCHSGGAPSAGLDLSTYNFVKNSAQNGSLVQRMKSESNPMPPSGLISLQERELISKWVKDGYLK